MLSTLAKKFLCICATSVSSERVFSTGGNIVISKRNSLKPHVIDQLIFLAKNLKDNLQYPAGGTANTLSFHSSLFLMVTFHSHLY